ncbi:MAG: DEAD/DEAH box helicase family protein [Pseudomonadota bacterium]|nr:DEAD/DEAH box helicase family protein [Pseudomonadota bacterium]
MKKTHKASQVHLEDVLEHHMVDELVEHQGYRLRTDADYDRDLALDPTLTIEFVRKTQPAEWDKLIAHYGTSAEKEFLAQIAANLKRAGTLPLLRHGMKIVPGIKFQLCAFKPASSINRDLQARYDANILSVARQIRYSRRNENEIDVVVSVNGIPVATFELKNELTGSTFRHAEKQYRKDRSPANEPLLTFKRGALVHFAMDTSNVSMTTRLMNGKTRFLPFNRGRDGGAGNRDIEGDHRTAYMWADQPEGLAILSRDVLLDVIGNFLHLEVEEVFLPDGTPDKRETMIFPRFQQLYAVRRILADARANGPGRNYLVQHSAGSGKSNTIAWLAHLAVTLHDAEDAPVFDTAIVVTDRIVLDDQLQQTVAKLSQTKGVVKSIDGTSKQLRHALETGARIIVTTIQKFGTEHLEALSGQSERRFAVIVDEAHGSQSGKSAQAMSEALSRGDTDRAVEDVVLEYQQARGPQPNISYFAFTATPRNVTLERFGRKGEDGTPEPFHLYSMRQAIEEGFILDVLQNYMTYKSYYELEKAIEDDPELDSRQGRRRIARFASLHPAAIGQKVEIIVEHFRRHVRDEIDGQGKAMIVTQSREHALRYFQEIGRYIDDHGYDDLRALVAFSGDLKVDGETYTEAGLNGFPEAQLPKRFDGPEYQVLVVAEKYQTGFDQKKLVAMYVDRKLAGLQAVQTLSRLNRTHPEKRRTFVLDFQNTTDDIQTAFEPFFNVTSLEAISDPNQIYDLERRIHDCGLVRSDEIERFAAIYYKSGLDGHDRAKLEGIGRLAVMRFENEDEDEREEFRQLLKSYQRFYGFISQIMALGDTDLEKLYSYGSWLVRLLPNRDMPGEVEITDDMVRLHAVRLEEKEKGSASLAPDAASPLSPISEFAAKPYTEEEKRSLSEIVSAFNERHGTEFTDADFVRYEAVNAEIMTDDLVEMLRANPDDVVYKAFAEMFFRGSVRSFQRDNEMKSAMLTDPKVREQITRHFFRRARRIANEDRDAA